MHREELLKELVEKNRRFAIDGNVANYIPELDKADKNALGVYVTTLDGQEFFAGDYNTKFTIQSISKIIYVYLLTYSKLSTIIICNWITIFRAGCNSLPVV